MTYNANNDIEVLQAPTDGISSLSFSPQSNLLVATSWDCQTRCWEVQPNGSTIPKASISHDASVLCSCWSGDGSMIFSGGCDNISKVLQLSSGSSSQIGKHDGPIKCINYINEINCLVTGSWDKTLKYWDGRQQNPIFSTNLPERAYSMDFRFPYCVVGTAERHVITYDIRNPSNEYKHIQSPLKYQTRCLALFAEADGFAIGSIEGRVALQYFEDSNASKNFAFKCHREGNDIFAVNVIAFNRFGTFATAGSDGIFHFWDKDNRTRLKPFLKCAQPISAGCFNYDGTIFSYAVSYDWSKGHEYYNPQTQKNCIFLHPVKEEEIKPKKSTR